MVEASLKSIMGWMHRGSHNVHNAVAREVRAEG